METTAMVTVNGGAVTAAEGVADMGARFLAWLDVKPATAETYRKALPRFFAFLAARGVSRPTRADVLAYRDSLADAGRSPCTISLRVAVVRLFFRWTATEGIYPNVADHVKGAKIARTFKKDALTAGQTKMLLDSVREDLREYAMIRLAVTCGLRTCEIVRANVGDIGTAGGNAVLYVQGKGRDGKDEYVRLSEATERALRAYLATRGTLTDNAPLFASESDKNAGGRMLAVSISGIIKRALVRVGLNSSRLTAHSLRHTAATLATLAGNSLADVQTFMRHADISTTQIYQHAIDRAGNGCALAVDSAIA